MSSSYISIVEVPTAVRWIIPMDSFKVHTEDEFWHFSCGDTNVDECNIQYRLRLFPSEKDGNQIMLELHLTQYTTTNISFKLAIPSANFICEYSRTIEEQDNRFEVNICTFDEFIDPKNNYFVNDNLVITMEAILKAEIEIPDGLHQQLDYTYHKNVKIPFNKKPQLSISRNLGQQLWNRDGKDFAFVVGGKEIMVHKYIISECHVFDKMIKSGLKETKENKVVITDFAYGIVELALKYCYGIEIEDLLTIEKAFKLMQFSDKYDISDLKTSMEQYLTSEISPMNVCKMANAAILSNSVSLREACFEYLLGRMKDSEFVKDLDLLDKDFAFKLFKAPFYSATY